MEQIYLLMKEFVKTDEVHFVAYKEVGTKPTPKMNYTTYRKAIKSDSMLGDIHLDESVVRKINYHILDKYLELPHPSINSFNTIIKQNNIDAVIMLGDVFELVCDQRFACYSIMWFPNHFKPLDNDNASVLSYFDHIVTLSPASVPVIKEGLYNKRVAVSSIPHIIEYDNSKLVSSDKQVKARKIHNTMKPRPIQISKTDYVVTIIGGNYEQNCRKSFATSFLAFKQFLDKVPNAFLYVQAFTHSELKFRTNLNDLACYHGVNIPLDRIYINQTRVTDDIIDRIYNLSDVVLIGSKSEGFGLPLLEAQTRGLPVVTNKFLAMADYTFYGESADFSHYDYDQFGGGMWSSPDPNKLAIALYNVYQQHTQSKSSSQRLISSNVQENNIDHLQQTNIDHLQQTNINHLQQTNIDHLQQTNIDHLQQTTNNENVTIHLPENDVDKSVTIHLPENDVDKSGTIHLPENDVDKSVTIHLPENDINKSVTIHLPENDIDKSVTIHLPENDVDKSVTIHLPENDVDKSDTIHLPENDIDNNESSCQKLDVGFEEKKDSKEWAISHIRDNFSGVAVANSFRGVLKENIRILMTMYTECYLIDCVKYPGNLISVLKRGSRKCVILLLNCEDEKVGDDIFVVNDNTIYEVLHRFSATHIYYLSSELEVSNLFFLEIMKNSLAQFYFLSTKKKKLVFPNQNIQSAMDIVAKSTLDMLHFAISFFFFKYIINKTRKCDKVSIISEVFKLHLPTMITPDPHLTVKY